MFALWITGVALAGPPTTGWETLTDGDVVVACSRAAAEPWCRARGPINAPPDRVYALLDDIGGHANLYERIALSVEFAPGYAHQVVKLPFPLDSRDYVVHLTRTFDRGDRVIRFASVARSEVPVVGLRLSAFEGEFRVHTTAEGRTEFSYLWQADLGPDIPEWALPLAWQAQGTEIVRGLRVAAEAQAGR